MQRLMPILVGLLVILAVLSSCVFVVRERDYALVFSLGEVRKGHQRARPVFQGAAAVPERRHAGQAHPHHRVQRCRAHQTSEGKNLLIDSYVKWRIADPRACTT